MGHHFKGSGGHYTEGPVDYLNDIVDATVGRRGPRRMSAAKELETREIDYGSTPSESAPAPSSAADAPMGRGSRHVDNDSEWGHSGLPSKKSGS